jgi:L-ascorbate metabolism protein UlaG (beta-lactamase superfamily)
MPVTTESVDIRVIGGPTTVIEIGGLRVLTDPTFDGVGVYELGSGLVLSKTRASAVSPDELGPVDVVLLSHDQHPDNLDETGRAYLADAPLILTTPSAAARLGGTARGLRPWDSVELLRADGLPVSVTATPALHGPDGCEAIMGEVTGFLLTGDGVPTVYVSGDNASLDVVRVIAESVGPVDTALIFAGAARTPFFGGELVTLDGTGAAQAAELLGARRAVVAHTDSWAHLTEDREAVEKAFTAAGLDDRLQHD